MNVVDRERVARLLGAEVRTAEPVIGGYTPAERWRVTFGRHGSAFVKIATDAPTRQALLRERQAYQQLHGQPFAARFLGFEDEPVRPLMILEDLCAARWPPPWRDGDLDRVVATVRQIETTALGFAPIDVDERRGAWARIAASPDAFVATGLASQAWLEASLFTLTEASRAAPAELSATLHQDLRSDNLCVGADGHLRLVDWTDACRGPAGLDLAFMAPSVRLEGGPLPEAWVPEAAPFVAWVAGFFASRAGLPAVPGAPRVRRLQHRQLRIALPWAVRVLGLPELDGTWLRDAHRALAADLAEGRIDTATWFAREEEDVIDAYLATDDPIRGSGKSGDAVDWRWSRELLLDAVPGTEAHVLDVGCANAHLMACIEAWGAERGLTIYAHGLEISERLAEVARRDHRDLAARIHVGNVFTWTPPRRYDLVHLGIDAVPEALRAAMVQRVCREFLSPGGRVVFRAARVGGSEPDLVSGVRALGFTAGGILEARHPRDGALRRTVWLPGF